MIPKRGFYLSEIKKMNFISKEIKKRNYSVINFNEIEDLSINSDNDFYNLFHLNIYGSTKYTLYFAKYLHEHYDLPDHRNDKKYNSWDKTYEKLKEHYKELTQKDFEELVEESTLLLNNN